LHHEGDVVTVRISDTGRGIPAEHLARVFEPFFTTRPVGEGSGVGLAVCHGIATRMGGTIGIESDLGVGTTVTVRLPRAKVNTESDA
jgi:two-component system NtrC family sensor kinase